MGYARCGMDAAPGELHTVRQQGPCCEQSIKHRQTWSAGMLAGRKLPLNCGIENEYSVDSQWLLLDNKISVFSKP